MAYNAGRKPHTVVCQEKELYKLTQDKSPLPPPQKSQMVGLLRSYNWKTDKAS